MRTLPDHLRKGMKLVIVGCNPSESSVRVGHYYAGRTNQFWPILHESGVVPEPFDYHDDKRVIEFGIGLTDLVKRPTKGVEELTRGDFAEGRIVLSQKLEEFSPHVVAFNGKIVYEQFSQRKCKFGLQKELALWRACLRAAFHQRPERPRQEREIATFPQARAARCAHRKRTRHETNPIGRIFYE